MPPRRRRRMHACPVLGRLPRESRRATNRPETAGRTGAFPRLQRHQQYRYKGRYHSPISQFGLEPMVMLFTRETEFSDPLKDLLKQIDNAVEKNPAARLHPFLVVQADDLPEVIGVDPDPAVASKDDDKRIELATKLEGEANALMSSTSISSWPARPTWRSTIWTMRFAFYFFQHDKVTASRVVKKGDKLDDAFVKEIIRGSWRRRYTPRGNNGVEA